jgi:TrkA domain protein
MPQVEETRLPGIGKRYDFETGRGRRLGILVHRSGRRALLVYREDDPDECAISLELEPDESRTLAELLGAPRVVEQLGALHQDVEGLRIDWITIADDAEWAGRTLAEAGVHSNTGVSVVALISAEGSIAAPGADDVLEAGATAVVVGSPDGVDELARRLRRR